MLKKQVSVCDTCQKTLSKIKCDLCDIDLCPGCISGVRRVLVNSIEFGILQICCDCKSTMGKISRGEVGLYDSDFRKGIVNELRSYIKGRILAEKL